MINTITQILILNKFLMTNILNISTNFNILKS